MLVKEWRDHTRDGTQAKTKEHSIFPLSDHAVVRGIKFKI